MSWLEAALKEGQAACVSHAGMFWVLEHTHKTLGEDADTEGDREGQVLQAEGQCKQTLKGRERV